MNREQAGEDNNSIISLKPKHWFFQIAMAAFFITYFTNIINIFISPFPADLLLMLLGLHDTLMLHLIQLNGYLQYYLVCN